MPVDLRVEPASSCVSNLAFFSSLLETRATRDANGLWIVAAKTLLSAPTQVGCTEETAGGEFTRPEEIGS